MHTPSTELLRHANVWPAISQAIYDKYEVVYWCDLVVDMNDIDLVKMYNNFLPFKNYEFTSRQRIIIYHRDSDYYTDPEANGFTMWNLYKLCDKLNIPSEFFIMLAQSPGIEQESNKIAESFNIQPFKVVYCPYQWCPMPEYVTRLDININRIELPFACLNGVPRSHRLYTLAKLKDLGLFDNGMISLWKASPSTSTVNSINYLESKENNIPVNLGLRGTLHPTRINDSLILNQTQKELYNHWYSKIPPQVHPKISGSPNEGDSRYQPEFLQLALWNVVLETVGDYPYSYQSEKIMKAILTKRPFIFLGGPNSLKNLKQLGFKTFDRWIDESYDNPLRYADRCDLAIPELTRFCSMSPERLQQQCLEMQEVLEYNFNHYIEKFGKEHVDYLINHML